MFAFKFMTQHVFQLEDQCLINMVCHDATSMFLLTFTPAIVTILLHLSPGPKITCAAFETANTIEGSKLPQETLKHEMH